MWTSQFGCAVLQAQPLQAHGKLWLPLAGTKLQALIRNL
jgi:hypothetical protein